MNSETFYIIETILEKSKKIEVIQRELPFNTEISHDLANRLKTCIAQVEILRGHQINNKKFEVLLDLDFNLNRGVDILYEVAGEEIILNTWNRNQEIFDISEVFHKLSANLLDLELKNVITVNTQIETLELKVKKIIENLQNSIKSFENLSQIQVPENIQTLSTILSCKSSDILKVHEKYQQYFKSTEEKIHSQEQEISKKPFFTNKAAEVFWQKNFSSNSHAYWLQFKSKIAELLDFYKYSETTRVQLFDLIRKKADKDYSGMVSQNSCNFFFNHFSFNLEKVVPELRKIEKIPVLVLKVMSSLTASLKVGSRITIDLKKYEDSVVVIGRDPRRVNISINEQSISAVHGIFSYHAEKGVTFTDLGSSGGSYKQITSFLLLKPGQVLQFASSQVIHIRKVLNLKSSKIISDISASQTYESGYFSFENLSKPQLDISNQLEVQIKKNETIFETSSEKEQSNFDDTGKKNELILSQVSLNEKKEKENFKLEDSKVVQVQDEDVQGKEEVEVETAFIEFEFVFKGNNQGRVFKFSRSCGEVTIGRDDSCVIQVDDEFVSSVHGIIGYGESGWQFQDNSSSNKSWICFSQFNELISRTVSSTVVLDSGQLIKIGNVDFLIEIEN